MLMYLEFWSSNFGKNKLILRLIDFLTFYISATVALFRITEKNSIIVAKTDPPLISVFALLTKYIKGILINWLQDLFPEVPKKLGIKIAQGLIGNILLKNQKYFTQRSRI